jgi:hypothetical protein
MNKKYDFQWDENNTRYERFLERLEDVLQWIYNHTINLYLDKKQRNVKVKLHNYDTWSMDHTLALIVLPMLKQLKETKHGSPMVDDIDVPQELRINDVESKQFWDRGELDDNHHARWDWALDEIIWAFEMKAKDDWQEPYYGTWIKDESKLLGGYHVNTDYDGMKAAQKRISNGLRLFGKYYENLWD